MKTRHHLLWPRRKWNRGTANRLRNRYAYPIDDDLHHEVHATLDGVPLPCDVASLAEKAPRFDDPLAACFWLIANSEDREFTDAIKLQIALLRNRPP